MMNDMYRQTGRTHRMLEQALSYAVRKVKVIVYTTEHHLRHLRSQAEYICHERNVRMPGCIYFEVIRDHEFDWESLSKRTAQRGDTLVVLDHHAIEQRITELDHQINNLQRQVRELLPLTFGLGFPVPAHLQVQAQAYEDLKAEFDTTSQGVTNERS